MPRASTLGKIEKEVEKLSPQEQLKLVERLTHQLRKTGIAMKKQLDWTGLYGLGKHLWRGEDAQAYVDRGRRGRRFSTFKLGVKKEHPKREKIY